MPTEPPAPAPASRASAKAAYDGPLDDAIAELYKNFSALHEEADANRAKAEAERQDWRTYRPVEIPEQPKPEGEEIRKRAYALDELR